MARTIVQKRVCAMPLWNPPRYAGSEQAALAIETRRSTSILGRRKIRDRQRFQRPQERKAESVMWTRLASPSGLGHIPNPWTPRFHSPAAPRQLHQPQLAINDAGYCGYSIISTPLPITEPQRACEAPGRWREFTFLNHALSRPPSPAIGCINGIFNFEDGLRCESRWI